MSESFHWTCPCCWHVNEEDVDLGMNCATELLCEKCKQIVTADMLHETDFQAWDDALAQMVA